MLALALVGTLLTACDKELDIKQAYAFRLETMPVQTRIVRGETAEIRCTLVREGAYDGARYTIRYFQPDGKGELPHGRRNGIPTQRPLSAHEGGVQAILHFPKR